MELEKITAKHDALVEHILNRNKQTTAEVESDNETQWQPVRHFSWASKQRELEAASRQKAIELAKEARVKLDESKSTAQLEAELLNGTE